MSTLPPARGPELLSRWRERVAALGGSPAICITDHLIWARTIARTVRRAYNFRSRSQEESDLEATAYLAIVELAARFDLAQVPPGGNVIRAFRGWAAIEVCSRCRREARRLRNGGTYNTRREKPGVAFVVVPLFKSWAVIDPRSIPPKEDAPEDS